MLRSLNYCQQLLENIAAGSNVIHIDNIFLFIEPIDDSIFSCPYSMIAFPFPDHVLNVRAGLMDFVSTPLGGS